MRSCDLRHIRFEFPHVTRVCDVSSNIALALALDNANPCHALFSHCPRESGAAIGTGAIPYRPSCATVARIGECIMHDYANSVPTPYAVTVPRGTLRTRDPLKSKRLTMRDVSLNSDDSTTFSLVLAGNSERQVFIDNVISCALARVRADYPAPGTMSKAQRRRLRASLTAARQTVALMCRTAHIGAQIDDEQRRLGQTVATGSVQRDTFAVYVESALRQAMQSERDQRANMPRLDVPCNRDRAAVADKLERIDMMAARQAEAAMSY